MALGNICFLIRGLFCGTSLPPCVGGLKTICISFIPHTTSKRFVCPLPSERAALLLLHHIGCGPRLKAGLLREFAASPRQHLEEWAVALILLLFDIYLSVSAVHFPYPMAVWNLTSLLYSFHDFLFLSEVEYFLFLLFSFPVWLRISLHNVIFSGCYDERHTENHDYLFYVFNQCLYSTYMQGTIFNTSQKLIHLALIAIP